MTYLLWYFGIYYIGDSVLILDNFWKAQKPLIYRSKIYLVTRKLLYKNANEKFIFGKIFSLQKDAKRKRHWIFFFLSGCCQFK